MIEIDNTLISEEILENDFVCNLDACKGACCVEGDAGAPVEDEEVEILERIYHKVAPYLSAGYRGTRQRWRMGNTAYQWRRMCLCHPRRKRHRSLWNRTGLPRGQNRLEKAYFLPSLPYSPQELSILHCGKL